MKDGERLSLEQIQAFLEGSEEVVFKAASQKELYAWTERTLCAQECMRLGRNGKGLVRQYVAKVTGLIRAQMTRLIGKRDDSGPAWQRTSFQVALQRCRRRLLAQVDEAHDDTLSGPATQKILCREFFGFADARCERLANISVAHICNLRRHRSCREKRMVFEKTRPAPTAIGERRRPEPDNRPGYLRVDTVHQGDLDGVKGVYHISAPSMKSHNGRSWERRSTSPKPG